MVYLRGLFWVHFSFGFSSLDIFLDVFVLCLQFLIISMLMRFSYTVVSASEFSKMCRFLQLNIDLKQTMIIVSSEIRQHVSLRELGVMFHGSLLTSLQV